MNDYFAQEANVELSQPADPWRLAEDIRSLLEIVFGENWKNINLRLSATSQSRIRFAASDLASLQQKVTDFGGPMRDISVDASLWQGGKLRSCDTMILFKGEKAQTILIHWRMPLRVDTEAFGYGVKRVVQDFGRRKRWAGAKVAVRSVRHQSDAASPPAAQGSQLIKVRGFKWGWRRWFVRNRDNIIVGLSVSTVVSVGVLVLQLIGLLPVPS